MPSDKKRGGNRDLLLTDFDGPSLSAGKSWFFGIGINTYKAPFSNLHNAGKDIEEIFQLLQERYELDEEFILIDEAATRDAIIDQLQILNEQIGKEDKLIIYYAGHGFLDQNDRGYWIPADAEEGRVATYIRNSTIREFIADINAKHTLLISDSCFSGALLSRDADGKTALEELERDRSRWVISSGRQREKVADGSPGKNSPFATSILKVLRNNQNSRLNTGLVFDQVMKLTRFNYQQLPQSAPLFGVGHEGGQYVFRLRASEEAIWENAGKEHSVRAYNRYLDQFPQGRHADEALARIQSLEDDQDWEKARKIDKVYAYRNYLRSFPVPHHAKEAHMWIAELEKEVDQNPSLAQKQVLLQKPIESPEFDAKEPNSKQKGIPPGEDTEENKYEAEPIKNKGDEPKKIASILLLATKDIEIYIGYELKAIAAKLLLAIKNNGYGLKIIAAILLLTIGWVIGGLVALVGVTEGVTWAKGGAIGGFVTGGVMKWVYPEIKWKQVFLVTIGAATAGATAEAIVWAINEAIGEEMALTIGLAIAGAIAGAIGGFAAGVMKWVYPEIKWKQVFLVAIGWVIGVAIGGAIFGAIYSQPDFSIEMALTIGVPIAGAIGGGVIFWQFRNLRN